MKHWEQLTATVGIWCSERYPVHEDALRLAEFAGIRPKDRVLDIGTGNGILAIYAEAMHGGTYTGIDVDETALTFAVDSAIRNGQDIRFLPLAAEDAPKMLGHGVFDRILMNPPYYTDGTPGERALARHGSAEQLENWLHAAFLLLNNGGTAALCYPAEQLARAFRALDKSRFAPKRMALIEANGFARLALIEAKKLGGDGMKIEIRNGR